jgi:hypothetical protein
MKIKVLFHYVCGKINQFCEEFIRVSPLEFPFKSFEYYSLSLVTLDFQFLKFPLHLPCCPTQIPPALSTSSHESFRFQTKPCQAQGYLLCSQDQIKSLAQHILGFLFSPNTISFYLSIDQVIACYSFLF